MRPKNLISFVLIGLLAAALTGCFKSEKALIGADEADYPFQTITYVRAGEDHKITLERVGDKYVSPLEKDKAWLRLKALGDNLFVVQIADVNDGVPFHLYGFIRLAKDRTSFDVIKGVADPGDQAAAEDGKASFSVCPRDTSHVCIGSLKGFIDYATKATGTGRVERFNILAFK
ncbi:MAG: hypothetical protein HKN11_02700 [Rhizobiales bacterium]|nr:hypothetical protein [Hyphomicrobiales bacterium]